MNKNQIIKYNKFSLTAHNFIEQKIVVKGINLVYNSK